MRSLFIFIRQRSLLMLHHKPKHLDKTTQRDRQTDRQMVRVTPRGSRGRGRDEVQQGQNDLISARTATSSAHTHTHTHTHICQPHSVSLIVLTKTLSYLTSVSHLGWPSRAAFLGGLGLIRTSP